MRKEPGQEGQGNLLFADDIKGDRGQEDQAFDHLLHIDGNAHDGHSVVQYTREFDTSRIEKCQESQAVLYFFVKFS